MSLKLDRILACLPQTERGRSLVVTAHPKGTTFLYCSGKDVIIRDIDDPSTCDVYAQHACNVLCAKYAPSTHYIASADKSGKLRIWDTTQAEHILKSEFSIFSGPIHCVDWDSESKRIAVAGNGREKFVATIMWDSGNTVGNPSGHIKSANSVAFKPNRPFRLASASEDFHVCFYEGPPFKFSSSHQLQNFVNCVAYAPSGEFFVSGDSSGVAAVFDGKSGQLIDHLGGPAHKGGIYGVSVSPDSKRIATVSGDKTVKLWAIENLAVPQEASAMFAVGAEVVDQQLGCVWASKDTLITVSLSGTINFFDPDSLSDGPRRRIFGHNKPISALTMLPEGSGAITASSDGRMAVWNLQTGEAKYITGELHSNQVQGLAMTCNGCCVSIGYDDMFRCSSVEDLKCGVEPARKLASQPKSVTSSGDVVAVGCLGKVILMRNGRDFAEIPVNWEPLSLALNGDATLLAVGGSDNVVRIYQLPAAAGDCSEVQTIESRGAILSVRFSPDGQFLAFTDDNRRVCVVRLDTWASVIDANSHSARVTCCAWSPNSKVLATGSLDTDLIVWFVESGSKFVFRGAHPKNQITGVGWMDDESIVSADQGGSLRTWKLVPK